MQFDFEFLIIHYLRDAQFTTLNFMLLHNRYSVETLHATDKLRRYINVFNGLISLVTSHDVCNAFLRFSRIFHDILFLRYYRLTFLRVQAYRENCAMKFETIRWNKSKKLSPKESSHCEDYGIPFFFVRSALTRYIIIYINYK